MATGSKLPTGRSKRRGARSAPDSPPTPLVEAPAAPEAFTDAQQASWTLLWADPMARFWTLSDGVLVGRLVKLRERLEAEEDPPLGMYAAALALERVLYLTPTARRDRLRLAVSDPPAAVTGGNGSGSSSSGRRPSARERERLLRG